MIKNYLIIALRNMLRHRGLPLLNISGLAALMIALLTVSYQSIRAATANPVDSLRYE